MPGIQNLDTILRGLDPELSTVIYTFASTTNSEEPRIASEMGRFSEAEGSTIICAKQDAEKAELLHSGEFQKITLRVHSSLDAVGLTAAVSTALAEAKIPCNIVAGFYHDHLFVPKESAQAAVGLLKSLQDKPEAATSAIQPARQRISQLTLVVPDYEQAIDFYTQTLGFERVEDTELSDEKRWVVLRPYGSDCSLLIAKAKNSDESAAIGNQAGGRVFLFLETNDFWRDYESWKNKGVDFVESPREEPYGTVVVLRDPFGNKWDLIQRAET